MARSLRIFVFCISIVSLATVASAQTGGTGGTGDFGNLFGNGGGGGLPGFDLGNGFTLQQDVSVEPSLRYETGFVGVRSNDVNSEGEDGRSQGFIGGRNEGDFGGGINDSITPGSGAAGNAGRAGGGAQGGFQGTGSALFFQVQRQGIRTRLSPNFLSRTLIQGPIIGPQFVSRMSRNPRTRDVARGYQVSVANRTATVTGTVGSQDAAKRIIRQLRLEPGVYRINNQLTIAPQ